MNSAPPQPPRQSPWSRPEGDPAVAFLACLRGAVTPFCPHPLCSERGQAVAPDPDPEGKSKISCCRRTGRAGASLEAEVSLSLVLAAPLLQGPSLPRTFGNIDTVGCQDVHLNAVYFHVQVLCVALRAGKRQVQAKAAWVGRGA